MEQRGWSSRCSHTVAGHRATQYKIVFPSLQEDSKASGRKHRERWSNPMGCNGRSLLCQHAEEQDDTDLGPKCNGWLHPTSLRPTPSTCTSLSMYIWLPMEKRGKKARERQGEGRMKFPWGQLSTLLLPADIICVPTMHSPIYATALPAPEPLTRLRSRGICWQKICWKRGSDENSYHEDAAN